MKSPQTTMNLVDRATELFAMHQDKIIRRTDRMFAALLGIEYLAGILAAVVISPRTWAGSDSALHIHVWTAVFLGAAIVSLPIGLALALPGRTITRHIIAVAQMLVSALLIHLTGGRIETHFHVFGSLAFLGFYREWQVLLTASVVVALDHFLRGMFWPQSVYGIATPASLRWLEHAGWVVFEDIFLVLSGLQSRQHLLEIAEQQARLEQTNAFVENAVLSRTRELQLANKNLRDTQVQLLQSQKLESIGQLAGGIAHDFNNILFGIMGYVGLLKRQLCDDEQAIKRLQIIEQSVRRGSDMNSQLLGFARKGDYEKKRFNLNQTVQEASSLLARSIDKNIVLRLSLAGTLVEITGDSSQLFQALMNLALNARDAMPDGGTLEFKTSNIKLDQQFCLAHPGISPGHYVEITVRDSGAGIPENILHKIFDPFFTTKEVGKGTGLGLSMVYGIVHSHGGTITVDSALGKGSTFKLYLPISKPEDQPLQPMDEDPIPDVGTLIAILSGKTILIADDEENVRHFLREMLEPCGVTVIAASDGKQAVELFQQHRTAIHAIILDVTMPVQDGIAAFHEIRHVDQKIPVLFSSGYAESQQIAALRLQAGVGFLQKPFSTSDLSAWFSTNARGG